MSVYSIGEELAGAGSKQTTATAKLREQVGRFFEETRGDVYRYLLSLGLHPPQAQEATQEVFLRLYASLRKGEKIRNPRGWIFRVAHNHGLRIRARQDTEVPFDPDLAFESSIAGSNPEKDFWERERLLGFHRAIENLSEQQRRCLLLRMEGLRYPEIGAALGISVSAVGEFLRRAVERLRKVSHG